MKTILQTKQKFILFFLLIISSFSWGQITYTGSPTAVGGAICPTTNVTSGVSGTCTTATTFVGNTIKAYVGSISGTNATINLVKCDGTAFGTGTYYLKTTDICGTVITSGAVSGTNVPINIILSHTGTLNYRITFTSSNGTKYYTNNIQIIGTCTTTNNVNPANITFSNTTTTQTTAFWPNVNGAQSYEINYILCSTVGYSGAMTTTSTGLSSDLTGLAPSTSYHMQIRTVFPNGCYSAWSGSSSCFTTAAPCGMPTTSMATATSIGYNSFTANWQAVTGANYYNIKVKKCTDPDYSTALSFQTSTNATSTYISGLECGACYNFQVQAVCSSGAGTWSGSNPIDIVLGLTNSSSTTFSNITASSFLATWPVVSGAIGYEVNYTTCAGTYVYQGLPTSTNSITISGLTASTSYKIQVRAKFGTNCFGAWGGSSNCVSTSAPIPSCITWSGTPPTGEKLTAANYLCTNNIIVNTQNGTDNNTNAITRELMAKITYLGIYKGSTPNSPAVNYPVPFTDMQGSTSQWLNAVKTLAYLQFSDDTTPFDRDFINFRPGDYLPRKYVVKVLAEAFNIPKSTVTPSPFSDVNTTDEMYGYIKAFNELGFVIGNTVACPSGTCFHPDDNITREDVFVILYRILIATNITRPTATELNSSANYYVPGNNRMATSGKVPDIDQANFNHYQKTSFSIAGRGVSLDFTHTYNSFLTELPKGYFEEDNTITSQKFTPLGIGWTHTYNIYAQKVAGYTFGTDVEPDKLMVYYPDGSINTFNYATGAPDGTGIYDTMSKTTITGGERITITTKGQIKYAFENYNNGKFYFIKSIKDRNNNGVKCTWIPTSTIPAVAKYKLSTVQEEFNDTSLGRSLTFSYASLISPYITAVADNSIGRTISFNINGSKNLISYTDPKGQITNYSYAPDGNITSNLLSEIQLPKGNKIRNSYNQRKLTSSKTVNPSNVVTSTTNVNWVPNYSTGQQYNSSATITDPQGKNTSYTHNTLGNPTSINSPTGTTNFSSYATGNNANLPTSITVNGQSSGVSYDNNGNILNVTKNGISNSFTYTAFNDIATQIDGRGYTTTYSYDSLGNLTNVQRPSGGGATAISRNSFGQPTMITNPSNIQTTFGYNTNGLTNQISLPLGIQTSSIYDNASRLLSTTDANGKTTSCQYDPNDNLTRSINPLGATNGTVDHTYDPNDNHLTIKNPKNETQTNTFNPDDDMLATETFGVHTKTYTYNIDGSLATFTRGNGTFTYTYDATTGRLLNDGQTQYTYDTRGNISTVANTNGTLMMNYDNNDRLLNYVDYFGNTVAYLYDENNNVTRITYPGNKAVNYVYDALNRCTSVTDWNSKVTVYTYLTDDRVSKITLPNGTFTDYTYDAAGRPTGILNKKSNGTIISSYGFTMDNAGNHLTETITEPSIVAGLTTISNQTVNYSTYPYNRIQTQATTNYTHNTAGGITQAGSNAFTYDLNDNMLTAPNSTFSYDGAGNRRSKTVSGVNTRYVLSILGMSQVLMETNASNAVQNYYVYGPTGLLYRVKADNTTYSYYHYDYRGSTTAITNEAQTITHSYSYDPFGKVLANTEADANPFQYVGQHGVQYESPTLTFMRARYYDPTTGRFVSEDPIWALNLYPYADNNPINKVDADGRSPIAVALLSADLIKMTAEVGLGFYESSLMLEAASLNYEKGIEATKKGKGYEKVANEYFNTSRLYSMDADRIAGETKKEFLENALSLILGQFLNTGDGVKAFKKTPAFKELFKVFNKKILNLDKAIDYYDFGIFMYDAISPKVKDFFSSKEKNAKQTKDAQNQAGSVAPMQSLPKF